MKKLSLTGLDLSAFDFAVDAINTDGTMLVLFGDGLYPVIGSLSDETVVEAMENGEDLPAKGTAPRYVLSVTVGEP